MTETYLAAALHRYIDVCGYSWPTAYQIVSRMAGRLYTVPELREMYRHTGPNPPTSADLKKKKPPTPGGFSKKTKTEHLF